MTSRDFCYWLQGFFEIQDPKRLTETQIQMIKKHLNMVFEHEIDPSFGEDQEKLEKIHNEKKPPQTKTVTTTAPFHSPRSPRIMC